MATSIKSRNIAALNWFIDHKGYVMRLPESVPLMTSAGETLIRSKACGIYKPEWSEFALSITATIGSPYNDNLNKQGDENWSLSYDQEGIDSNHWRNQSLVRNIEQGLPVGVLLQEYDNPSIYRIFGLGRVSKFENRKFHISSL